MPANKPLIIIAGATAVGKTEQSVVLAKRIGGEIISADSMQVYKGMDIGTAKITASEMQGVRHYLIDELEPTEDFNIYEFKTRAVRYINEIYEKNKIPIIAGGTGFYIQSVLYDIDFSDEDADKSYRFELEEMAEKSGCESLYEMLKNKDPQAAAQIHPNNVKRVIRALEYNHNTGRLISAHNEEQRKRSSPYDFVYFVLNRNRSEIYERIEKRVDLMFENGLVNEVQRLLDLGIPPDTLSMQGLGYKETVEFLAGVRSLDETKDLLKKNTRHFSKRQITWFKREPDAVWMNYEEHPNMAEDLCKIACERLKIQPEK